MRTTFHQLSDVAAEDWLALLNNKDVHRHMPLGGQTWTADKAMEWAAGKDAQWDLNGYGPWAIRIDGAFAGWGGFQKEDEDADFGLVLLPSFWGHGRVLHEMMIARGFDELGLESITILLPPSRKWLRPVERLGYRPEGEIEYEGHRFLKFRLMRPVAPIAPAA